MLPKFFSKEKHKTMLGTSYVPFIGNCTIVTIFEKSEAISRFGFFLSTCLLLVSFDFLKLTISSIISLLFYCNFQNYFKNVTVLFWKIRWFFKHLSERHHYWPSIFLQLQSQCTTSYPTPILLYFDNFVLLWKRSFLLWQFSLLYFTRIFQC